MLFYRVRKHSFCGLICIRARLQSCRKTLLYRTGALAPEEISQQLDTLSSLCREDCLTHTKSSVSALFLVCLVIPAFAQDTAPKCTPPQSDSSFIDEHGTAHVTRVVPVPDTLSPEAQKEVAAGSPDASNPESLAQRRAMASAWQVNGGELMRKTYPVNIAEGKIAGVPVRIVTPPTIPPDKQNRVLINLHGGGFNADWGSEIESIPVANLTQTKVVAVLYSLAPEHPFPTALNEAVAVYKELLKTYKPQNIGIYGTSAGAILTGEVASRLRQLDLPLPGALGIFSGSGDFSKVGDSRTMYALRGLSGPLSLPTGKPDTSYSRNHHSDRSGIVADLCRPQGLPADALPHQWARPAAQQHSQLAARLRSRWGQHPVGSV